MARRGRGLSQGGRHEARARSCGRRAPATARTAKQAPHRKSSSCSSAPHAHVSQSDGLTRGLDCPKAAQGGQLACVCPRCHAAGEIPRAGSVAAGQTRDPAGRCVAAAFAAHRAAPSLPRRPLQAKQRRDAMLRRPPVLLLHSGSSKYSCSASALCNTCCRTREKQQHCLHQRPTMCRQLTSRYSFQCSDQLSQEALSALI